MSPQAPRDLDQPKAQEQSARDQGKGIGRPNGQFHDRVPAKQMEAQGQERTWTI